MRQLEVDCYCMSYYFMLCRKTTENKPGASKYRRWENRHDEHDTDFHYNNDRETSIKAPPAAGSVQRFNVHQSDKPSSGVFGISYKPNRGPQDVEDIRHQNEVKGLPERFSNSVNSRSKWGQFTETKSDDQDTCTLDYGTYKQGEVKILPKQFGSPVNSRSKWQQYTNTDVDYQDALDYGTYKQGQVKDLPKQSGISFKSRSKWEQYTETDVDDLGIVDYGTYKQCEPKPGISVESRSKWGQYTETEVDNEDAVDYGTYEQDGTNSDWVTSDEAIIDNKTSGRDYLSFEQGHPTNFEHEEDNLDCFKGSSFYEKKSETQTFAPSLIKNEGKKTREFSSKTKHSLSSYNNNSKWSKFINEDCSHETEEDGNDLNALSKSRPNDPSELRDRVHHPLTDGGKIHNPLTELDRNKAKRETDTASHIGMTCMDFPSEHMTISNSKVIHSDSNSGLLLQPKENITTNSQKENKLLFTVGELSDDDFDL